MGHANFALSTDIVETREMQPRQNKVYLFKSSFLRLSK